MADFLTISFVVDQLVILKILIDQCPTLDETYDSNCEFLIDVCLPLGLHFYAEFDQRSRIFINQSVGLKILTD